MREQSNTASIRPTPFRGSGQLSTADEPQDDETFALQPTIAHVDLTVAAPSPWTHRHVDRLRALCAPHNLKFDHIAFPQGSASPSYHRCVMDKDIRAVAALDKTISLDIREPFNAAKDSLSFKSHLCSSANAKSCTNGFSDKPYKALHANGTTSRLAAVVRWFRYPSFKRKSMPFRSVYSADNNAWLTRFPDSQAVRGFP